MKTKGRGLAFATIFTAGLFAFSGYAFAEEFSADFVMQEKGEGEFVKGRIFIKGDKIRQEMVMGREKQIMIFRLDKGVTWVVYPEEEMYMELPYQAGDKKFERWSPDKESKAKYLGKETVSGLLCRKYQITEIGEKIYVWISEKFPFLVRMELEDVLMEYRNIKEVHVPNSLFEIPPGYEKMSMPMMPGGMPQIWDVP